MTWLKPLIIDKDMDDAVFSGTGVFIPFMTINIQKRRFWPIQKTTTTTSTYNTQTISRKCATAVFSSWNRIKLLLQLCCRYWNHYNTHHTDLFFIAETTMTDSDPQKLGRHWRILETFFPSSKLHRVVQNWQNMPFTHAHIELFRFLITWFTRCTPAAKWANAKAAKARCVLKHLKWTLAAKAKQ